MDHFSGNIPSVKREKMSTVKDELPRSFDYSIPAEMDDNVVSSSSSTPYYTPLEFFQTTFEFPSPILETPLETNSKEKNSIKHSTHVVGWQQQSDLKIDVDTKPIEQDLVKIGNTSISDAIAGAKQQMPSSSPVVNRNLRRFSLYERRSRSPHNFSGSKNISNNEVTMSDNYELVDDKENTNPENSDKIEDNIKQFTSSGSSSPITLIDECGSPKIIAAISESSMIGNTRLAYSPKLLASINNLSLSGSPLGVISSAGYKNGNYFKFPEIDHVVQSHAAEESYLEDCGGTSDNQKGTKQKYSTAKVASTVPATSFKIRFKPTSIGTDNSKAAVAESEISKSYTISNKNDYIKNRKNKNNLTIKILDVPNMQTTRFSSSTSPKSKTPTIKSTKEKALSLDSAAGAVDQYNVMSSKNDVHTSCHEIDTKGQTLCAIQLELTDKKSAHIHHRSEFSIRQPVVSSRSTTLSHLSSYSDGFRTPRRRISGSSNNDWLQYHRKQNPFKLNQNFSLDISKTAATEQDTSERHFLDLTNEIILKEVDEIQNELREDVETPSFQQNTTGTHNISTNIIPSTHRGVHKLNPILQASNTNLKTLPEFLTLVEFSTLASKDSEYPYKQKSIDFPSCTQSKIQAKNFPSTLSSNLLQRRGSNHSLTLNLHGSCSNLLGSSHSGLSVSNYNLGPVVNSTTNLNSKSSCNLDYGLAQISQLTPVTTQGAKQTSFRRRGSNPSLTATSCGNLNSFDSQASLNVDRIQSSIAGVTRTTSFTTAAKNKFSTVVTPKRGLLERRGSNQSLTLNMGNSFGGIGTERNTLDVRNLYLRDGRAEKFDPQMKIMRQTCFAEEQRKFFSSDSLHKANTQFSELNQAHKRNANQVCFGSVSDLNSGEYMSVLDNHTGIKRENFDFEESKVCTCTGVRNIMTRPLSPQTTSEEFKIYLANIQILQNASNALNREDLIKLNYIFDNNYVSNSRSIIGHTLSILNVNSSSSGSCSNGIDISPGLSTTSEDYEVTARYEKSILNILQSVQPDDDEQKRMFRDLHKEFWDLPLNHQEKPMVFGSQTKNRYKTILPNENSRVILDKEDKQLAALISAEASCKQYSDLIVGEVPYINANYIKGPDYTTKCYVATQGPLPNTMFEFWLMIYQNTRRHFQLPENVSHLGTKDSEILQQYYQKIIMLTNLLENNRQKCSKYFPVELNELFVTTSKQEVINATEVMVTYFSKYLQNNDDNAMEFRHVGLENFEDELCADMCKLLQPAANFFIIKNVGIVRKNGFSIRKLVVLYCMYLPSNNDDNSNKLLINKFYCYHYWYPDWPDHRSPRDINTLLDICLHILNLGKCEAEFPTFSEELEAINLQTHLKAHRVSLYQQDIFNLVQPMPVIHCSAGIGRTGCLTAILNGIRQLRQSLAYSLTSMASALSQIEIDHKLSPVDFCLPKYFIDGVEHRQVFEFNADTDSSFTRNTLLYIKYILSKNIKLKTDFVSTSFNSDESECQTPTLAELSKIPDIFVDILGIVCNLRLQRGGMVQNSEQYELIHRAICLYLKRTFALKRF